MKSESLVIADQHAAVNTFPGLVHTARHTMGVSCSRSGLPNPQGKAAPKECLEAGEKAKQGSRRGTCGWITSFLRSFSRRRRPGLKQGQESPQSFRGCPIRFE